MVLKAPGLSLNHFAPDNRTLSWFIGGINYQIEHHLFSTICHVHNKRISPVVRSVMKAFNLPYHEQPTFRRALLQHATMLRKPGKE